MKRPANHVTRTLDALRAPPGHLAPPPPDIDEEFVKWCEKLYPPRCYDDRHESLEDHLRYAGVAAFVQRIRSHYEDQQRVSYDPEDEELDD